jgi:hypothetical protein
MAIKLRSLSLKEDNRLEVFEGRLQKRVSGSQTQGRIGTRKDRHNEDLRKARVPYKGDHMKKNGMETTCYTYGRNDKCKAYGISVS